MSDFERSGMTFDEPAKRRSPGTFFADLGDRLARGFNNIDRPPRDDAEPDWEEYDEYEQPTAAAEPIDWDPDELPARPSSQNSARPSSQNKRFPTALHGYDREAVDAHLAALERELVELRVHRVPEPSVEAELERLGTETSAILKVAHEQAAEITRRAQVEADRCVSDAASNAVSMTEEAKRKLRQLDSETDAVWAERGRLIEDVRSVATALFSLAEDAADRFPEEGDKRAPAHTMAAAPAARPASPAQGAPQPSVASPAQTMGSPAQMSATAPQTAAAQRGAGPVPAQNPRPAPGGMPPHAASNGADDEDSEDLSAG